MKYDEIKGSIKKHDFVQLLTKFQTEPAKYVVLSVCKDFIKVAPILEEDGTSAVCPTIAVPHEIISKVEKYENHMLLFYSDLNNLHIEKAILSKNNNRRANAKI
jgi:hypothetical protein